MVSDRIRLMGAPHWIALFAAVVASWAVLAAMSVPAELRDAARIFGAEFWESFCTTTPDAAGYARLVTMWMLMSGAMMAPTALPAFATYDDLSRQTEARFDQLIAGYLVIWLGFSIVVAALQMGLFNAGLVSAFGDSRSFWLSGALLIIAGLYQFSALKEACLSKCRQPLTFFMAHWEEGAWRNGLRLGAVCLGCCWALMLLAFVGGMTSLGFMGIAMIAMTLEKMQAGAWLTRPLGIILIGAGIALPILETAGGL